jgi:riboflavin kinase
MVKVKSAHIPILIELLLLGAKDRFVEVSTTSLAGRIGKSQQASSRHLLDLEETGFVERIRSRGRNRVKITENGKKAVADLYGMLRIVLDGKELILEINGEVFTGLGEGAYYMSMKGYRRQFVKQLGFEGFEDGQRTYGWAKCFFAKIKEKLDGAVIILERAHYDHTVLEVIAPVNIRDELDLKDGDMVPITIYPKQQYSDTS